jgi:multisubunit Na+/H+ antiporter MnhE subunit
MRRFVSLVVWWALLFLLWLAYVGTTQTIEVLAGIAAAAIAAVALEVARAQRLLNVRFERRHLFSGLKVPVEIVFDFGVVTWELVRRRRVQGEYVEVPFPAGEQGRAQHVWRRAYATTVGTLSPNAIVVEIDPERNVALLHSLRPDLRTGRIAL